MRFGTYLSYHETVAMGPQTEAAPQTRVEYRMAAAQMGRTELQHIVVVLAMALAVLDTRLAVPDKALTVLDMALTVLDMALTVLDTRLAVLDKEQMEQH